MARFPHASCKKSEMVFYGGVLTNGLRVSYEKKKVVGSWGAVVRGQGSGSGPV